MALHRTSVRHPLSGARVYLSAPDLYTLRRRKAYLQDVRRELQASARCPHCGEELASRVSEEEAGKLFDGAAAQNVGRVAARRVKLLPAIEKQIAERPIVYQAKARAVYRNQFVPFFAKDTRFLELTPARVTRWIEALRAKGYSAKTTRDAFDALSAAYKRLVRSRTLPERPPWEGVERPRVPSTPERPRTPPTRDEFVRLVVETAKRSPARARLYLFAALTGLRNGELVALAWDDLDGELLHVRHTAQDSWRKLTGEARPTSPTKGKRARSQRLHPQALAVLAAQRRALEKLGHFRADGPIWPDEAGAFRGNNNAIRPETIQRDAQRAGIGRVSAHVLRHANATFEAETGAPAVVIASRLGHRSVQTSERYIHARGGAASHIPHVPLEIPE